MATIEVINGDITKIEADAIVNAANTSLLGGGGVDGAIHRAAGPELMEACRKLNGCPTGQAKITRGFKLPANYVIHTVGPVWRGGANGEAEDLANCYRNSLRLAVENDVAVIAFPGISVGAYRFPKEKAAEIAFREVRAFLNANDRPEKVIFVTFDNENHQIYQRLLAGESR